MRTDEIILKYCKKFNYVCVVVLHRTQLRDEAVE